MQIIKDGSTIIAYVIDRSFEPSQTQFITDPTCNQQVGYIVYDKGGHVKRHFHNPIERNIIGTTEVLIIKKGSCLITFYDECKAPCASITAAAGTVVVILDGGHEIQMLDDTIILEIKQGPYPGPAEKELF